MSRAGTVNKAKGRRQSADKRRGKYEKQKSRTRANKLKRIARSNGLKALEEYKRKSLNHLLEGIRK